MFSKMKVLYYLISLMPERGTPVRHGASIHTLAALE
jgi:hypothetical protein